MSSLNIATVTAARAELWDAGYRPIPIFNADADVPSPGKQPLGKAWQVDARKSPPFCARSPAVPHALNTGILSDGLRPVDIDVDQKDLAFRVRSLALEILGDTIIRTRENSGHCLLPYRAAHGSPPKRVLAGRLGKIEVLGHGQQFVALGHHPTCTELHWVPVAPQQMAVKNLPAVTEEQITTFFRAVAPLIEADPPGEEQKTNGQDHASADPQADTLRIATALAAIPNVGAPDWDWWNRVCMAVWRAPGGSSLGFELIKAWSARNAAYDRETTRARWDHYTTSPPTEIGARTIFHMAAEAERRAKSQTDAAAAGLRHRTPTLRETSIPRRVYIVPGYIQRGVVTEIVGPGGHGKSLLFLSWAVALAPGRAAARAGGAPPRHDWDALWIEVALCAAKHDLDPDPAHRRDLQQHMVEWAAHELDTHLDEETIRRRLSRLFQVVAANWRAPGAQLSR